MLQLILSLLLIHPITANKFTAQVKGTVIAADTRAPVANAYLYIVKGEEEALTNSKGEFTLTTAEHMPVSITVIHKDYRKTTVTVNDPGKPLTIAVQRK